MKPDDNTCSKFVDLNTPWESEVIGTNQEVKEQKEV
jgi:hypothetical protein